LPPVRLRIIIRWRRIQRPVRADNSRS
jgi:hypothetical protein